MFISRAILTTFCLHAVIYTSSSHKQLTNLLIKIQGKKLCEVYVFLYVYVRLSVLPSRLLSNMLSFLLFVISFFLHFFLCSLPSFLPTFLPLSLFLYSSFIFPFTSSLLTFLLYAFISLSFILSVSHSRTPL